MSRVLSPVPYAAITTSLALASIVSPLTATSAFGQSQQEADPGEAARFRFGPLRFTPSIVVSNLGVDNNVFNEVDNPKRDTTAAFGPAANYWLRMGKARLSGRTSAQYLYFKEFSNQRSWNGSSDARIEMPLARLTPFISGVYTNSRERPGYEIDSRARRRDQTFSLGTDLRLSGKTTIVLTASQNRLFYDREETFLGASLADALDRTTNKERLQLRYALTPLTTFVLTSEGIQDRFSVADDRDADSIRVMPGFEMKPFALISGTVAVGIRRFNVLGDAIPDFNGLVASAALNYAISATQLAVRWNRDLEFSYQAEEPYYALNDVSLTITQRITRAWDVVARGGRQSLAYRLATSAATRQERVDVGAVYGAGIGYRFGESIRLGIDANYYKRDSDALGIRNYEGLRAGASVSYGLPQ